MPIKKANYFRIKPNRSLLKARAEFSSAVPLAEVLHEGRPPGLRPRAAAELHRAAGLALGVAPAQHQVSRGDREQGRGGGGRQEEERQG